jgi:phospholipase C
MRTRLRVLPRSVVLALLLGASLATDRVHAATPRPACAGACSQIKHIVIMVKENRTFDSMFGTFPHADGATTYIDLNGSRHSLGHEPDSLAYDIGHTIQDAKVADDSGKLDRFVQSSGAIQKGKDVSDAQFYQSDIPNYWTYARRFTLDDHFFSTIMGNSFANHLFTIGGQDNNADGSPSGKYNAWGCDSPRQAFVEEEGPSGQLRYRYPCYDFPTLADSLDQKHIAWRYYAPAQGEPGYFWSAFDAIKHIRTGPDWKKVVSYTNFEKDARTGKLPAVSWLVQPFNVSDHPGSSVCQGENWTVRQINAIMSNTREWAHTAIILTWDDWGGLYDHVRPPKGPNPRIEYGFRVPALVISPYAHAGVVDHTQYDFSSLPRFVERVYGLPPTGPLDARANDMLASFNFHQQPLKPLLLSERSCPPLRRPAFRPVRLYVFGAGILGMLGTLFLTSLVAPFLLARRRPAHNLIRRGQISLGVVWFIVGLLYVILVISTYHRAA